MQYLRHQTADDVGKLLLRLSLAAIVLFHGIFKITHGVEWIKQPLASVGLPGGLAYGTYVAEVAAPVFLILGLQTRFAALVIVFDMLMAMLLVLRPQLAVIKPQGGGWAVELEGLILLVALSLVFLGGGRHAITRPRPTSR